MAAYIYIFHSHAELKECSNKTRFDTKMWARGVIFSIFSYCLFSKTVKIVFESGSRLKGRFLYFQ